MALSDNLISYWSLEEASGNALDAHGSNHLTDTNTVGTATGKVGNGRDFDSGSSEYFTVASNATLQTGDIDFTVALWFKPESIGAQQRLVSKGNGASASGSEYVVDVRTTGLCEFIVYHGSSQKSIAASDFGNLSAGNWYFIVVRHDATNDTVSISINGTATSSAHSDGVNSTASVFRLGASGAGAAPADGVLDEVGFWKRILSTEEETELYNSGSGRDYSYITGGGGDETAPVLTSPSGTATSDTTADLAVTTDEDNGTLYVVVTESDSAPSASQVKAGQDHTGAAAAFDDSQAIASTGVKTFNATGLTGSTGYYAHFMHEDDAENQSDVASSSQFTTDETEVAPDTPTLSAGTPTPTSVVLTSSAFADDNSGDTHVASQWQVTTAADTGYVSPVISTGDDASNLTSYTASGLTVETDYIARVRHKDSTGLYSEWSSDEEFTTPAVPVPDLSVTVQGGDAVSDGGTDALGTVAQNSSQSRSYTITNDGDATATLGTITVGSGLTITADPSGQTIAAEGTKTLTVSVTTSAVAEISAAISIPSDDADSPYNWTLTASVTDQAAPTVTALRINGDILTVRFNEAVSGDLTGLTLTASGGALTVTGDDTITTTNLIAVQLSRTPAVDETITADYSDVSGTITDAATNELASFSDRPVTIASGVSALQRAVKRFRFFRPFLSAV